VLIFDKCWIKKGHAQCFNIVMLTGLVLSHVFLYLFLGFSLSILTYHENLYLSRYRAAQTTSDKESSNESSPRKPIVLESSSPVVSVAFGSGAPENEILSKSKKTYWTRFNFNTDIVATGHINGRIRIWSVDMGKLLIELIDHKSPVRDLAFAPDGSLRLISASLDTTLKVKKNYTLNMRLLHFFFLAFSAI